jgi:hypothetical protein
VLDAMIDPPSRFGPQGTVASNSASLHNVRSAGVRRRRSNTGGTTMHMMLKVNIPVGKGNEGIRNGNLPKIVEGFMKDAKPETAFFTADAGKRTMFAFFDMKDVTQIPSLVEPFFMGLDAEVVFSPVMSAEELKTGLGKFTATK